VNRTERLLDLIAYLTNARRPVAFDEIREWFPEDYDEPGPEAAHRKFERDKADLQQLGIPLRYVPAEGESDDDDLEKGGYIVDREQLYLPELSLAPDEMAVLYLSGLSLLSDETFPYREALRIALGKIELRLPVGAAADAALAGRVHIDHAARDPDGTVSARLALLEDAVRRQKRVSFDYHARYNGVTSARVVEPYGLSCRQGRWALCGFSKERQAIRVFLVHRMANLTVNAQKPGTPDFVVPADFQLADHAGVPAWRYELSDPITVGLEVRQSVTWLAESELRTSGTPAQPGWVRFTVEATNPDALVEWVLGMGPNARIVAPEPLRQRVRQGLERALAQAERG